MRCNHVTRTTFCCISVFVQKAELCDAYDWDAYLELYDEDSEYHIPQWIDDHNYVQDPNQGLSYIYYADRTGLKTVYSVFVPEKQPLQRRYHVLCTA